MKRFALFIAVFSAMTLAGAAWAGQDKAEPQILLELDLVDGSHVIGIPNILSVPVQTSYAKMDVPLNQIISIKMGEDHETASLELRNGDKLKGIGSLAPIKLETVFGRVSIAVEHIRELRVVLSGGLPEGLKRGLVLHYSFDRDEGDKVTDASGMKNGGNVHGAKWTPRGKRDGAFEFNGKHDYIEVRDDATLNPKDQLTLSTWVRIKDYGQTFPAIISKGNIGNYRESYGLFVGTDGKSEFLVNRDGTASGRGELYGPGIPLDLWTHVAGTFDGRVMRLYVNGKESVTRPHIGGKESGKQEYYAPAGWPYRMPPKPLASHFSSKMPQTAVHAGGIFATSNPLLIGKADRQETGYPTTFFSGFIDEVMVYNRALTAEEVAGLYRAGSGRDAGKPDEQQITVPGNGSADAGEVTEGQRYWFKASGLVGINVGGPNGGPATKADPDGRTISQVDGTVTAHNPADARFPCPGLATHSLVGKIVGSCQEESSACVQLGRKGSFVAPASGRLTLLCNDLIPGDNSGTWDVKIGSEPGDAVAWGESVNGLQAGLALKGTSREPKPSATFVLTVRNAGREPVRILKLSSYAVQYGIPPLEIRSDGKIVQYQGLMFEPAPPPYESNYITLKAGDSDSTEVTLALDNWKLAPPFDAEVVFVLQNGKAEGLASFVDNDTRKMKTIGGLWTGEARSKAVSMKTAVEGDKKGVVPPAKTAQAATTCTDSADGKVSVCLSVDKKTEGDRFTVGQRTYAIHYVAAQIGESEIPNTLCLSHDGEAWVIDRFRPNLKTRFTCKWPVVAVSADVSRAIVWTKDGNGHHSIGAFDIRKNEMICSVSGTEFDASHWRFSKDGRYAFPLLGLLIFDKRTGNKIKSVDFGVVFNARWLGVSFSSDAKLAVVAAPYSLAVSFIDNSTLEVVQQLRLSHPPAGAFLIESEKAGEPGVCFVVTTNLPYE